MTLLALAPTILTAATLDGLRCGFSAQFIQNGTATPVAAPAAYEFLARVDISGGSLFQSGTVTAPDGFVLRMNPQGDNFAYRGTNSDLIDFDNEFPNGNYTLSLTPLGGGKAQSSVFKLTNKSFPPAPYIKKANDLDAMDPGYDLAVSWNSWSGGTSSDRIVLRIQTREESQTVFETSLGSSRQLDGNATGITIPAGTLRLGTAYFLVLNFLKAPTFSSGGDVPNHPEAAKLAYVQTSTWREFQTTSSSDFVNFFWASQANHTTHWESSLAGSVIVPGSAAPVAVLRVAFPSDIEPATVVFNGPGGSGLSQTPGTGYERINGWIEYQEAALSTGNPPSGTYSARINGITRSRSTSTPPAYNQAWAPIITVIGGGYVDALSWTFRQTPEGTAPFPTANVDAIEIGLWNRQSQRIAFHRIAGNATRVDTQATRFQLSEVSVIRFTYVLKDGTRHTAQITLPSTRPDPVVNFFSDSIRKGEPSIIWITNPWYGWFTDNGFPWIYHLNHGYLYLGAGTHAEGYYVLDARLGWMYFSKSHYEGGWMYRYSQKAWIYYLKGTNQPLRWFYLPYSARWVREDALL